MRQLLVTGDKTFKISVPDDAKITFGPWSPPKKGENHMIAENVNRGGTLRIYDEKNVIAVFSNVISYRDLSLQYSELVAKEEGATIWKSDEKGYERESRVNSKKEWVSPRLTNGESKHAKK